MLPKKKLAKPYKKNLIGKEASIQYLQKTFTGKIINETKNTIIIKTKDTQKTILKNNSKIIINNQIIYGNNIKKRTEQRIKSR